MLDIQLFKFEKSKCEGIYKKVKDIYRNEEGRIECEKGIQLLTKMVNTDIDGYLSQKDKTQLHENAISEFCYPETVEHVLEKFCVLMGINSANTNSKIQGLAKIYTQLQIEPDQNIKAAMNNVVRMFDGSNYGNERELASRFRTLLSQDPITITIMDAIDAAFLNTFDRDDRLKFGSVNQRGVKIPALMFFQAAGKRENESPDDMKKRLTSFLNTLFSKRNEWPNKIIDYAFVWVCRNMDVHAGDLENILELMLQRGYWGSMLDCSLRYEEKINEKYLSTLVSLIKPIDFKEKLKNDEKSILEFDKDKFTQLTWGEGIKDMKWPDEGPSCIMLLGEAGAGKTTQMEHLYCKEICNEKREIYPLWINIKDLARDFNVEDEKNKLIACIKKKLGKVLGLYEEMMREGLIMLFLDGMNELLVNDNDETRNQVLSTIMDIKGNYPKVKMCMTDRCGRDLYWWDSRYHCAGVEEDTFESYCNKYFTSDIVQDIKEYCDTDNYPDNVWVFESADPMTPQKMLVLGKWMEACKKDSKNEKIISKDQFDILYINMLLQRERDKGEFSNIDKLATLLRQLIINGKSDSESSEWKMKGNDIYDFFLGYLDNSLAMAEKFYNLSREIPLIVEDEREKGKYRFVSSAYYKYFLNLNK